MWNDLFEANWNIFNVFSEFGRDAVVALYLSKGENQWWQVIEKKDKFYRIYSVSIKEADYWDESRRFVRFFGSANDLFREK